MTLSKMLTLALLLIQAGTICGCHTPSRRVASNDVPGSNARASLPAEPVVDVVVHFARVDAKKEELAQARSGWRHRVQRSFSGHYYGVVMACMLAPQSSAHCAL